MFFVEETSEKVLQKISWQYAAMQSNSSQTNV
jgi:hypothetical protein